MRDLSLGFKTLNRAKNVWGAIGTGNKYPLPGYVAVVQQEHKATSFFVAQWTVQAHFRGGPNGTLVDTLRYFCQLFSSADIIAFITVLAWQKGRLSGGNTMMNRGNIEAQL
jgi:hypothetical protein